MRVSDLLSGIVIMGLDVAKEHTGVFIYNRGEVTSLGFQLTSFRGDVFEDIKLRRDLRKRLYEVCGGDHFDLIVIEDVYGGSNFQTVRALLNLNTVVDGMILDGEIGCERFMRVTEPEWFRFFDLYVKSCGVSCGAKSDRKGYVRDCVRALGYNFDGGGFSEDRYDAFGMAVGMFYGVYSGVYAGRSSIYRESDLNVRWVKRAPVGREYRYYEWDGKGDVVQFMCRVVSADEVGVIKVSGSMLGSYALRKGFSVGEGYIVFRLKRGVR